MADQAWNWSFFGFHWPNGNKPVQDWFNGLPDDAKDELRDVIGYLQHAPPVMWKRPKFDPLAGEDVTEVRFETATEIYRVYGYFGPAGVRGAYTFLHGTDKKRSNDKQGKREASKRRKHIERREATVHPFEFYPEDISEIKKG